ncbi:DNA-directed RNA polymerase subunit beta [Paenibacillus sanguinis]|uniref:DNA-directed RNA polymerase subunit beta n=1 Tax=Paenibacillus sanguinis TaxID=225906 RepID=UPI00036641F1|nr:DNA-directed RNA polymerase subunit beta [Paenibacillus sanguinis]
MSKDENEPVVSRATWVAILRIVVILLILVLALVGGAFVGYVVFGKQDPSEIWNWSTWRHVFDLVFAP